jgi:hypothetical protein
MPETLLNVFEGFYGDLPETVRDDLLFMMVMLSDEDLIVDELDDIGERARALFGAQTFIGRIGNLISAASVFDVYFALDPSERFGLDGPQRECSGQQSDIVQSRIHNRYADRRRAILAAKQARMELRRTTLSPGAIANALVATNQNPGWERPALAIRPEPSGVCDRKAPRSIAMSKRSAISQGRSGRIAAAPSFPPTSGRWAMSSRRRACFPISPCEKICSLALRTKSMMDRPSTSTRSSNC